MFTRAIEFSIIFTHYSDRLLLLGSGSLPLNSVFPTEMGNFKTTDNFAEIYRKSRCISRVFETKKVTKLLGLDLYSESKPSTEYHKK